MLFFSSVFRVGGSKTLFVFPYLCCDWLFPTLFFLFVCLVCVHMLVLLNFRDPVDVVVFGYLSYSSSLLASASHARVCMGQLLACLLGAFSFIFVFILRFFSAFRLFDCVFP